MHEYTLSGESKIALEQIEQKVVKRLNDLESRLNLHFWPESMGMILAAESADARFSLGSNIVKAVWDADLSDDQLQEICSKIEDKFFLFDKTTEDLKKDIQVLGLLLSRIQIDFKNTFANNIELKISLLTKLLASLEVVADELERSLSGAERTINAREYLESNLKNVVRNFDLALDPNFSIKINRDNLTAAKERYQTLLNIVQKIDENKMLERTKIKQLLSKILTVAEFSPTLKSIDAKISADDNYQQVITLLKQL